MPWFKSKAEKERERQQSEKHEAVKSFQLESWEILNDCIEELKNASFAPKEQTATASSTAQSVEVTMPEMAIVMDPSGHVISIVGIEDPALPTGADAAVSAIQNIVDGKATRQGEVVPAELPGSTALICAQDRMLVTVVWHGPVGPQQYDTTAIAAGNVLAFLQGNVPQKWSDRDYSILYYSLKYTFGKDVEPVEGLAERVAAQAAAIASTTEARAPLDPKALDREITGLIEELRSSGFSTARLQEIRAMEPVKAKRALDKFRSDLQLTRLLEVRFYRIDTSHFPDEAEGIMRKLRNMDALMVAADEIQALDMKVTGMELEERLAGRTADGFDLNVEKDPMFAQSMDMIRKLEEKGWDTRALYRALYSGHPEHFTKVLKDYREGMDRLGRLEERLIRVYAEGYESQFQSIHKKLKDPTMARTAEMEFEKLSTMVRDDSERERIFGSLKKALDGWTRQGFNVAELKTVLTKDPQTIMAAFKSFGERINEMAAIERELNMLDTAGFEREVAEIRHELLDPTKLANVRDDITTLKYWIKHKDDRDLVLERLNTKIARWWEEGYDVSMLKASLTKDMPLDVARDTVSDFESFVELMKEHRAELDGLYLDGFEAEAAEIRGMMNDVSKLPVVSARIETLKSSVFARMDSVDEGTGPAGDGEQGPPMKNVAKLADAIVKVGHRLPVALWGKEPKELAEELLAAKYGQTPSGDIIVRLGRRWYYGDPKDLGAFLANYNIIIGGKAMTPGRDKK